MSSMRRREDGWLPPEPTTEEHRALDCEILRLQARRLDELIGCQAQGYRAKERTQLVAGYMRRYVVERDAWDDSYCRWAGEGV